MKILEVIRVVDQMVADGVIERYAIGGAVGATFYLEPVSTLDVDIFIELHATPGSVLLDPIFRYLRDSRLHDGRRAHSYQWLAGPVHPAAKSFGRGSAG